MIPPDPEFLPFGMLNGALMPASELKISPLGSGFMFGEGLFETIRVKDTEPRLLSAHCARIKASMRAWGVDPDPIERGLATRCAALIVANDQTDGSLKLVVFKEALGWSELIVARGNAYPPARYEAGFRLQTVRCADGRGPLSAWKSLNYLGNLQAKRSAVSAGFDDQLFLGAGGQVLEGATANLFIVKAGVVATPPLSAPILSGVMRAHLLGLLAPGLAVEKPIFQADLLEADEVFVTNALLGVMPVAAVDSTAYDLGNNPITRSLM